MFTEYISFNVLSVFLALFTIIVSYYCLLNKRWLTCSYNYFTKQGITGPVPSFPTGTWGCSWKKNTGNEDLDQVIKYGKVYGTFNGTKPNLIVADPKLIKNILDDDVSKYGSQRASSVKNEILKNSLIIIEGNESKELKKVANTAFSNHKVKELLPRVSRIVDTLAQNIMKDADSENKINITQKVEDYISDALGFTMFSLDVNADSKVKDSFMKIVTSAFSVGNPNSVLALTPFIFPGLGSLDDFVLKKDALAFIVSTCLKTVQERRKQEVKPEGKAVDFVDMLLAAVEEEKAQSAKDKDISEEKVESLVTDNEIAAQCLSVVLSIVQTSRNSLALSLHTLAALPQIQEKLRSEVETYLQKHSDYSYELIQDCEYLDMFLGEILRIYPIEYRLERICVEDAHLGDANLQKGILVSVPVYAIHRHSEFYPEPDTFDPERFSRDNSAKRDHYTYLPFGQAGATSTSVGTQLSVLITKLAIAVLVAGFSFSPVQETKVPVSFIKGVTGVPRTENIWLKVQKNK